MFQTDLNLLKIYWNWNAIRLGLKLHWKATIYLIEGIFGVKESTITIFWSNIFQYSYEIIFRLLQMNRLINDLIVFGRFDLSWLFGVSIKTKTEPATTEVLIQLRLCSRLSTVTYVTFKCEKWWLKYRPYKVVKKDVLLRKTNIKKLVAINAHHSLVFHSHVFYLAYSN